MKKALSCSMFAVVVALSGCVTDSKTIDQMTLPVSTSMDSRLVTDWQEKSFIAIFNKKDIEIDRNQNSILLTIPNEKVFESTTVIKDSFKRQLDKIALISSSSKNTKIKVIVNSDDTLPAIESFDQTAEQALLISDYLKTKGVENKSISFFGVGSHQPLADNSTEAGQKINRRLEIQISND